MADGLRDPRPASQDAAASLPLWPLALAAGLLPPLAALLALWLSMGLGLIPACNPFVDGCVSVSRAARHGLPNHLFRALVLPAATLQGLVWLLLARWLRASLGPTPGVRALAWLGPCAALALVLYGAFLGTEGATYRLLRQYGTVVYFGFTCLGLLLAGGAVQALARRRRLALPRWLEWTMLALAGVLVALGLGYALAAAWFDATTRSRFENVTEWWAALILMLGFCAIAALWWRLGVRAGLGAAPR